MKNPGRQAAQAPEIGKRQIGKRLAPLLRARGASGILWFCLLLGLACRFVGLNWDEGAQLHPDERFCVSIVERMRAPNSLAQGLNSRVSPLNPANLPDTRYVYGQLPLFALKIASRASGIDQIPPLIFLGRFLAALADCATVGLTFLIARRLFEPQKALFCATLVACAALHIQQSHFFVVDPFAAMFLTASFWAGARLVEQNRARGAVLMGAFFGAALACKISAGLFGVAIVGFWVVLAHRFGTRRAIFGAVWVFLAAAIVFRLGHPMAFRGETGIFDVRLDPRFWRELGAQSGITRGAVDVPFNVQWIGRAPLWFSLQNLGSWGYGWPFLLSAGLGAAMLARRPRGQAELVVAALFALALFGVHGFAFSKFTRYFLPLTPFCALLAAHGWREIEKKQPIFRLAIPLVALSAAAWAASVSSIWIQPHPRIAASRWIEKHVAPGTFVGNETAWDEGLPLGNVGLTNDLESVDLEVFDADSPFKTANLAAKLDVVDWVFLSSGRAWQNIPRWPQKWPVTSEFYRALFDGKLGFRLEKRFDSFPRLGSWQFPDFDAEEALTVYDHPQVLLFRKTKSYDSQRVWHILGEIPAPKRRKWRPNLAPEVDESALLRAPQF